MDSMTPERLTELRAVAAAAFPVEDWAIWEDLKEDGFVHVGNADGVIPEGEIATSEDAEPNPVAKAYTSELGAYIAAFDPPTALALIAALEAKTAEVDAKADYVSDLEERVRQRDNHVIPVLHARIKEAERERDEARAEVDDLAADPGHKAAKYWKWWQREKARADRAEEALERVRELHERDSCIACDGGADCPTIQAIEGADDA